MSTGGTVSHSTSPNIIASNSLQINASATQEYIWSIETGRHKLSPPIYVNNTVIPLIIKHGVLSIQNIRSTVGTIIEKCTVLRTALYFDESHDHLLQEVQPVVGNDNYSFELTNNSKLSTDGIKNLIENEIHNTFARLEQGLVVRCHLIKMTPDDNDKEHLKPNDMIIFIFHPVAFNHCSVSQFLNTFEVTYNKTESYLPKSQYIDFTLYEYKLLNNVRQNSNINEARQFWLKLLHGYDLNIRYSLSLMSTKHFSQQPARNYRIMFNLESNLTSALKEFASLHNVSMMQLGLTCFMCFLYEYSNCTIDDVCVASTIEDHSLMERKTVIGPGFDIQPYRVRFNPQHSLIEILTLISELNLNAHQYDQYPYPLIMNNADTINPVELPFYFQYYSQDPLLTEIISLKSHTDEALMGLHTDQYLLYRSNPVSNDLTLTMLDNHDKQAIHLILQCSANYYDETAPIKISQHFEKFLTHMFTKDSTADGFEQTVQSIGKIRSHLQIAFESTAEILQVHSNLSNPNTEMVSKPLFETTDTASDVQLQRAIANIWQDVIYNDRFDSSSAKLNQVTLSAHEATHSTLNPSSDPFSLDASDLNTSKSTMNFSSLGGDSLQFVQVYQRYQLLFNLDAEKIPTRSLFECNTIEDHVKLIAPMIRDHAESQQWRTLHIDTGKSSL